MQIRKEPAQYITERACYPYLNLNSNFNKAKPSQHAGPKCGQLIVKVK